jgi:hypothetical protein
MIFSCAAVARGMALRSMRSMRSMRGGFIFRNRGPSLKVHHGQCLTSMTKHDSGGSPPGPRGRMRRREAVCDGLLVDGG